jgi:hypothetical protein
MRLQSLGSAAPRLEKSEQDSVFVPGALPAAILVGAGLGLALIGLIIASGWQWLAR